MVKHIVIYTLKEGTDKESAVEEISGLLEPLVGKIPGLNWLEVCQTYQGDMDYCLYSEFESREALDAYQVNPLHLQAKDKFHHYIATRVCADYEY